jgi:hypothetical protein
MNFRAAIVFAAATTALAVSPYESNFFITKSPRGESITHKDGCQFDPSLDHRPQLQRKSEMRDLCKVEDDENLVTKDKRIQCRKEECDKRRPFCSEQRAARGLCSMQGENALTCNFVTGAQREADGEIPPQGTGTLKSMCSATICCFDSNIKEKVRWTAQKTHTMLPVSQSLDGWGCTRAGDANYPSHRLKDTCCHLKNQWEMIEALAKKADSTWEEFCEFKDRGLLEADQLDDTLDPVHPEIRDEELEKAKEHQISEVRTRDTPPLLEDSLEQSNVDIASKLKENTESKVLRGRVEAPIAVGNCASESGKDNRANCCADEACISRGGPINVGGNDGDNGAYRADAYSCVNRDKEVDGDLLQNNCHPCRAFDSDPNAKLAEKKKSARQCCATEGCASVTSWECLPVEYLKSDAKNVCKDSSHEEGQERFENNVNVERKD